MTGEEPYSTNCEVLLKAIRHELKNVETQKKHGIKETTNPLFKVIPKGYDPRDMKREKEDKG
jgi:hypothetical protein